jgi:hypothetical protein
MYFSTVFSSFLLATSVLASPTPRNIEAKNAKALYFITNGANNKVAALGLNKAGKITSGVQIATGGKGQTAFFGKNGTLSQPDSLLSQSPVTVAGNVLFAVNAGSNDMTAFAINPNNPTQLTQLGAPSKLPGTFPNTVSASTVNNLVCVGMSGAQAGLSCAKFDPKKAAAGQAAVGKFDALRPFNLAQSDPPVGPQNTLSHVLFVSDQDAIRAFVKGSGKKNSQGLANGFIEQFFVNEKTGLVDQKGVKTAAAPGSLLFGSADLPKRGGIERTLTSDAATGARVFHYNEDGNAVQDAAVNLANAGTPCWTVFSKFTKKGYVSFVDNNKIVEVDQELGAVSRQFANNDANPGFTDLAAGGTFVYALSPGAPQSANGKGGVKTAVATFDLSGKQITEVKDSQINAAGVVDGQPAGLTAFF